MLRYTYDENSNITYILTPNGNHIFRKYDLCDRLIEETHLERNGEINNTTILSYDKLSKLVSIVDNNGNETTITYDILGRIIKTTAKDGGVTRTFYNKNGDVTKVVKPNQYNQHTDNGEGYCYTYDIEGRIVTVIAPDGTVVQTNTYDEFGRLINQVDANNSGITFEYDLQGNKTKIQTHGGAKQTFSYDARGNIVGTTDLVKT